MMESHFTDIFLKPMLICSPWYILFNQLRLHIGKKYFVGQHFFFMTVKVHLIVLKQGKIQ